MSTQQMVLARKELKTFFSSPAAFLFLGTFLLITAGVFFWVSGFFVRDIADVKPLFSWMPVLLIVLVAVLTMRMWSEEKRSGTLEFLLTMPVSTTSLVLGKFLACLALVALALLLTLPIPIVVSGIPWIPSGLGDLDWGPVRGGYLAALLLAAAYTAVGLYISSKTDNQIVSFILTCLVCGALYLVGSPTMTNLFGNTGAELLSRLGSGTRFESITRGVIDVRDLYYYLSITAFFLTLNVYSVEKLTWSAPLSSAGIPRWRVVTRVFAYLFPPLSSAGTTPARESHRQSTIFFLLIAGNLLLANVWLDGVRGLRMDLTKDKKYSISQASHALVDQLQEPLLVRGYFSSQTHPLLAPLVPQLRDLLKEYEANSSGKLRVEFVDPRDNPSIEEEANRKYSIKPVPFQISGKYEAKVINSYFHILFLYGDKYEVLSFEDLVELKVDNQGGLDVLLRNPEYDITRSIKKVLYGFRSVDNLFSSLSTPVQFKGFISPEAKLPPQLSSFRKELEDSLTEMAKQSGGKLAVEILDPADNAGQVAKEIAEKYGFRPMMQITAPDQQFYFYMTLGRDNKVVELALPENLTKEGATDLLQNGLKRFSTSFMRTVGIVTPKPEQPSQRMPMMNQGLTFEFVKQKLQENYNLSFPDLSKGVVPDDVDMLVVLAPENYGDKELFAVDQFLMRGGSVVLASSPFKVSRTEQALTAAPKKTGLEDWLKYQGVSVAPEMVLDQQNEPYPVPYQRRVGMFSVQEIRMIDYPFFVNIRSEGMDSSSGILSGLPELTLNWASPVTFEHKDGDQKTSFTLVHSSKNSWSSESATIQPDFSRFPKLGFEQKDNSGSQPSGDKSLGLVVEGVFNSYFAGKDAPVLSADAPDKKVQMPSPNGEKEDKDKQKFAGKIDKSSESARLVVVSSDEFLNDQTLKIAASGGSNSYMSSLQLIENILDWSSEDRALLSIRGRSQFANRLNPIEPGSQLFWEYTTYALELMGLLCVLFVYKFLQGVRERRHMQLLKLKVYGGR